MRLKVKEKFCSQLSFQGLILSVVSVVLCKTQEEVSVKNEEQVTLGGNVTLQCNLTKSHDITQVTWQKNDKNGHFENVATYSDRLGIRINEKYQGQLNFTHLAPNKTAIILWKVNVQHNGCYKCIFNTYPGGAKEGKTCLTVYEHLRASVQYNISDGHLAAFCSSTAFPRPVISWTVPEDERGQEQNTSHPNGTISVINSIHLKNSRSLYGKELICRVMHMGKSQDYKVLVTEEGGHWFSVPVLLTVLAFIFVILILIVVCWRRHRKKDGGEALGQV
uniref:CD200 molecule n=1 Tax=Sphenodon punctatus TaxID=8508 RepID=A0A8D0G226_SPHPU